jgi:F0F1-type ATP synthase membrane subunit a
MIYIVFAFVFLMSNTYKLRKQTTVFLPTIKSYIKYILSNLFSYTKESIYRQNMFWSKEKLFVYFIFYYFAFVLIANLAGLIPFLDTITATLLIPFFLSITSFIALHFLIARR